MTLRARIAVTAAIAVAVAVLATSLGVYAATARTLQAGTDEELARIVGDLQRTPRRGGDGPGGRFVPGPRAGELGGAGGFIQLVDDDGLVLGGSTATTIPVTPRALAVADRTGRAVVYESLDADGVPVRVLTQRLDRGAVQVALPIDDTVSALARLRRQLAFGGLAGIALAAGLGTLVARRAIRPVEALTALAEDVSATGDLTRRIEAGAGDEVGRLATTFNAMLANLEQARRAQQQLVADASHELRTPLTSLRTNIEVLEHADRLSPTSRRELIADVVGQLAEFGRLVDGLVELARGDQPARAATAVRLDDAVEAAVERVRTFARDRTFTLHTTPTTVLAEADRLDRAVSNLLDNAVKHGEGGIEVVVRDGTVQVRDHGPGIAEADLPHVFDRFYRSPEARSAPGSGLGLSIVSQVASSHGGEASAANASGGGALLTLSLPVVAPDRPAIPAVT